MRSLPAAYQDGTDTPLTGLPSARYISNLLMDIGLAKELEVATSEQPVSDFHVTWGKAAQLISSQYKANLSTTTCS